ncbi:MAG: glycosyltransferase family 4 protein [bacterium]|nr:glycosyltransferase family 4 protein [bacterium]
MKTVWVLNHHAHPPDIKGGTRHHDLCFYLTEKGYNVTLFCSSNVHMQGISLLPPDVKFKQENSYGVDYVFINTKPPYRGNGVKRVLNMLSYYFFMRKHYKKFGTPDIVIGSSVHPFAVLAAEYIARKTGAKFLSEIRDLWPETLVQMGRISKYHPIVILFKLLEKKIYKKSGKIIVLLPNAYEYIKQYNVEREKVVNIPNGVDVARFDRMQAAQAAAEIPQPMQQALDGGFCCVYTGAHGVANSLEPLLLSAEILQQQAPDIKYIFVGSGPEKKNLQRMAEERQIKNVLFFDPVKKEVIPAILSKSRINLVAMKDLPLYKYGISLNKLFDYMCSAKPVVFAGNVYNDLVKMSGCGISVPADDHQAFADAVLKLYKMTEEERAKLGQKGKAYVLEHHSMEKLADKLEALF